MTDHQDSDAEANTHGEIKVNNTLYDKERVLKLKDNDSFGEDSTTTKVPVYENQRSPVNSSAKVSHENPMLPKSAPYFKPKPDVLPNQPPKVISPGCWE